MNFNLIAFHMKKIGIRFYLNTECKPSSFNYNKNLTLYPVYVRVCYNRKNTRFRYFPNTLLGIENQPDPKNLSNETFKRFENKIIQIIKREIEKQGDRFEITGIAKILRNEP